MADRPFVIGIGNEWRRDDGVGPWIANELSARGWETLAHGGDGAALIDLFESHSSLLIVDASRSDGVAGKLREFDAIANPVPAEFFHYSTHRFGLAEAIETARALGQLPENLTVYGIEGGDFSAGEGLSEPVQRTAENLLKALAAKWP